MAHLTTVGGQTFGTVAKQLAGAGVDGIAAGVDLPAANGDVDIERIKLGAEAAAAGFLSGDERRARAHEGVEHGAAALGDVAQSIRHHGDRLDGRVGGEQLIALVAEGVEAAVGPEVGAVAAVAAEFHVIGGRFAARLEDADQLVLIAVKRSHPRVGLRPNADIVELKAHTGGRRQAVRGRAANPCMRRSAPAASSTPAIPSELRPRSP